MTKNRLETFSDSLIAIVITLLAFDLKAPISSSLNNADTLLALTKLLPQFLTFVLSFLTISIMWINHHYITSKIEVVTHKTVWSNSLLLLFIAIIPFVTDFLGKNPYNQIALISYSVVLLFCSLGFTVFKRSSLKWGTQTHVKETFKHIGIYAYIFAIFVAAFSPQLTYFVLVLPPLSYILPKLD